MQKSTDLAYLAGIIDGEGTITLTKNNRSDAFRRIDVSVANTDRALIDWLKAEFGGKVRTRASRKSHWKTGYEWRVGADQALRLLKRIRRYLRIKRPRADLICARWAEVTRQRYTESERAAKVAFELAVLAL